MALEHHAARGELLRRWEGFGFSGAVLVTRSGEALFAALAGVPFVALPYASKVTGFLEDLGMEVPPLAQLNAGRLIAHIDRSWDQQQQVRSRISERLPELQKRARETNELVVRLLAEPVPAVHPR